MRRRPTSDLFGALWLINYQSTLIGGVLTETNLAWKKVLQKKIDVVLSVKTRSPRRTNVLSPTINIRIKTCEVETAKNFVFCCGSNISAEGANFVVAESFRNL